MTIRKEEVMRKLCKETMIRAYSGTSFTPEKRAESDFKYYSEMLESDLR